MSTITQVISALHDIPTTADQANFDANADDLLGEQLPNLVSEINTWRGQANTVAGEVNTNAAAVATATPIAQAAAASATSAPGTSGTSTTSLTLALGQLSFTTQTGKTWAAGMRGKLARTSDAAVQAQGYVVSHNSGTGAVVFQCEQTTGGGPFTDWTFSHEGAKGNDADLVMPVWAPGTNSAVTSSRNGNLCRPSAAITLTPDSAASLGAGFSMLIAPTTGNTTVVGIGTVASKTAALLTSDGTTTTLVAFTNGTQIVGTPVVVSNVAAVDFTGLEAGYDYCVRFSGVRTSATLGANLLARLSTDNGATFGSTTQTYHQVYWTASSASGGGVTYDQLTEFRLLSNYLGTNAAPNGADGEFVIYDPGNATNYKGVKFSVTNYGNDGNPTALMSGQDGKGRYKGATAAINGIRIFASTGNLYGTFILERTPRS